jgi:predicted nucleic acid-binding protein
MTRYILDTDHVSLILRGDLRLQARVAQEPEFTSIIPTVTFLSIKI